MARKSQSIRPIPFAGICEEAERNAKDRSVSPTELGTLPCKETSLFLPILLLLLLP